MHWAAQRGVEGVLRLLLGAPNADQSSVDCAGLTVLDLGRPALGFDNQTAAAWRC